MIIYFNYLFILTFININLYYAGSSSIRTRTVKNDLVPFAGSKTELLKKDDSRNSLKIISDEPFIIQLGTTHHEGNKTKKDVGKPKKGSANKRKTKSPAKRVPKVKAVRKRQRKRREAHNTSSKGATHSIVKKLEIEKDPIKAGSPLDKLIDSTVHPQNLISREKIFEAFDEARKSEPDEIKKEEPFSWEKTISGEESDEDEGFLDWLKKTGSAKWKSNLRISPIVGMFNPTTLRKGDRHPKEIGSNLERLDRKINSMKKLLAGGDSELGHAYDGPRVRRKTELDRSANKIAKMFLTLSAINSRRKPKCKDDDYDDEYDEYVDDDDNKALTLKRTAQSTNEERYKVKKWIEQLKSRRSNRYCPCNRQDYNDGEDDTFPLEDKVAKALMVREEYGSNESGEGGRGKGKGLSVRYGYSPRMKGGYIRNRYNKINNDLDEKLKALRNRGKKKLELPLDDLEVYRSRAKKILQNAEDILDKIKEEEQKRIAKPEYLMNRLKELTSRIQSNPRNNGNNDFIRLLQKNLGLDSLHKVHSDDDENFADTVKAYLTDPYEKAKELTEESAKQLSVFMLENLAKLSDNENQLNKEGEGADTNYEKPIKEHKAREQHGKGQYLPNGLINAKVTAGLKPEINDDSESSKKALDDAKLKLMGKKDIEEPLKKIMDDMLKEQQEQVSLTSKTEPGTFNSEEMPEIRRPQKFSMRKGSKLPETDQEDKILKTLNGNLSANVDDIVGSENDVATEKLKKNITEIWERGNVPEERVAPFQYSNEKVDLISPDNYLGSYNEYKTEGFPPGHKTLHYLTNDNSNVLDGSAFGNDNKKAENKANFEDDPLEKNNLLSENDNLGVSSLVESSKARVEQTSGPQGFQQETQSEMFKELMPDNVQRISHTENQEIEDTENQEIEKTESPEALMEIFNDSMGREWLNDKEKAEEVVKMGLKAAASDEINPTQKPDKQVDYIAEKIKEMGDELEKEAERQKPRDEIIRWLDRKGKEYEESILHPYLGVGNSTKYPSTPSTRGNDNSAGSDGKDIIHNNFEDESQLMKKRGKDGLYERVRMDSPPAVYMNENDDQIVMAEDNVEMLTPFLTDLMAPEERNLLDKTLESREPKSAEESIDNIENVKKMPTDSMNDNKKVSEETNELVKQDSDWANSRGHYHHHHHYGHHFKENHEKIHDHGEENTDSYKKPSGSLPSSTAKKVLKGLDEVMDDLNDKHSDTNIKNPKGGSADHINTLIKSEDDVLGNPENIKLMQDPVPKETTLLSKLPNHESRDENWKDEDNRLVNSAEYHTVQQSLSDPLESADLKSDDNVKNEENTQPIREEKSFSTENTSRRDDRNIESSKYEKMRKMLDENVKSQNFLDVFDKLLEQTHLFSSQEKNNEYSLDQIIESDDKSPVILPNNKENVRETEIIGNNSGLRAENAGYFKAHRKNNSAEEDIIFGDVLTSKDQVQLMEDREESTSAQTESSEMTDTSEPQNSKEQVRDEDENVKMPDGKFEENSFSDEKQLDAVEAPSKPETSNEEAESHSDVDFHNERLQATTDDQEKAASTENERWNTDRTYFDPRGDRKHFKALKDAEEPYMVGDSGEKYRVEKVLDSQETLSKHDSSNEMVEKTVEKNNEENAVDSASQKSTEQENKEYSTGLNSKENVASQYKSLHQETGTYDESENLIASTEDRLHEVVNAKHEPETVAIDKNDGYNGAQKILSNKEKTDLLRDDLGVTWDNDDRIEDEEKKGAAEIHDEIENDNDVNHDVAMVKEPAVAAVNGAENQSKGKIIDQIPNNGRNYDLMMVQGKESTEKGTGENKTEGPKEDSDESWKQAVLFAFGAESSDLVGREQNRVLEQMDEDNDEDLFDDKEADDENERDDNDDNQEEILGDSDNDDEGSNKSNSGSYISSVKDKKFDTIKTDNSSGLGGYKEDDDNLSLKMKPYKFHLNADGSLTEENDNGKYSRYNDDMDGLKSKEHHVLGIVSDSNLRSENPSERIDNVKDELPHLENMSAMKTTQSNINKLAQPAYQPTEQDGDWQTKQSENVKTDYVRGPDSVVNMQWHPYEDDTMRFYDDPLVGSENLPADYELLDVSKEYPKLQAVKSKPFGSFEENRLQNSDTKPKTRPVKMPTIIEKIMKDLSDGKDKDISSLQSLDDNKIDTLIDKIDKAGNQKLNQNVQTDCMKECACADEIETRSKKIGRYEIVKDFLHWVKDLRMNRVLADD